MKDHMKDVQVVDAIQDSLDENISLGRGNSNGQVNDENIETIPFIPPSIFKMCKKGRQ